MVNAGAVHERRVWLGLTGNPAGWEIAGQRGDLFSEELIQTCID